jgi:hypothetical protein
MASHAGAAVGADGVWQLSVSLVGNGAGEVTSDPPGIACRSACSMDAIAGGLVTLTAGSRRGSVFAGWKGGCAGEPKRCILLLVSDTAVAARFELPCVVPDVVGTTLARARHLAREARCLVGHVTHRYDAAAPAGRVVGQVPKPGSRLRPPAPVRVVVSRGGKPVGCKDLAWPARGPIGSPFGPRWGRMHEGIDIDVPYGTAIHVAAPGRVVEAGWEGGYGNFVVVDHGRGISTAYGHQSRIAVRWGQVLAPRQVVGYVGCTGSCTGPHVHFEVRIAGVPIDPLRCLRR